MARIAINREALVEIALALVQQQPGCGTVQRVAVTSLKIMNDGAVDWHLQVTDPGNASVEEAYHAAATVKETLASKFVFSDIS